MILTWEEDIEHELVAGRLFCGCGGRLAPWSYARKRLVRQRAGPDVAVRPRRARCTSCRRTHVLLASSSLPRRRDATEVVGTALHLAATGHGHRAIAEQLDRPPSTVRNWLRRARGLAEELHDVGVRKLAVIDPMFGPIVPRATPLARAVEVLGLVAAAIVRRLGSTGRSPWCLINMATAGLLVGSPSTG